MNLKLFKYFSLLGLGLFFCSSAIASFDPEQTDTPTAEPTELGNKIVRNTNGKGKLATCGTVSSATPCVYYVFNGSRNDRLVEDFFEEVSEKTGRPKYIIAIENAMYSKYRVAPGYFAEIIVPALK